MNLSKLNDYLPKTQKTLQSYVFDLDSLASNLIRMLLDKRPTPWVDEERAAWDIYMARGLDLAHPEAIYRDAKDRYPGFYPTETMPASMQERCETAARLADYALLERRKRFVPKA